MAEGHARFQTLLVGPAKTAGVGQLEADDQIIGVAVAFLVRGHESFAQLGQFPFIVLANDKLMRVGAAIRAHRHGFAAANQFGPADAKARPAPQHIDGDAAGAAAVPAFHGVDGITVADAFAVDQDVLDGSVQGRGEAGFNGVITRQAHAQLGKMLAKTRGCLESRHTD